MENNIIELACIQYNLEVLSCLTEEMKKIRGFTGLEYLKASLGYVVNEYGKYKESLLTNENDKAVYAQLESKLAVLLQSKKAQIVSLLDIDNIPTILGKD